MRELRITNWQDFQEIGCFWMQHIVARATGQFVRYDVYGSEGQGQGGVDLVPANSDVAIVGQSKCWNARTLSWSKIVDELKKTSDFPGPIDHYVILTTAARHTSVQLNMPRDCVSYQRRQGIFQARIFYWDELQDLNFVPEAVLRRIFPFLFAQVDEIAARAPCLADHTTSLVLARELLPKLFPLPHLDWLASWNFESGYVPSSYFDLFHELSLHMQRVLTVVERPDLRSWLNEGIRAELFRCLPAAAPVYQRTIEFARGIVSEAVTDSGPSGERVLAHGHNDTGASWRLATDWKRLAQELLRAYGEVVQGMPQE